MPRYVAFLRAVNVGGRTVRMADLRARLAGAGLPDVETYIQTGNLWFTSSRRSCAAVERDLEPMLAACCGFDVVAVVLTPAELRAVHDEAVALPSPLPGEPRRYVTFLKTSPTAGAAAEIEGWDVEGERVAVRGRVVHWWLSKPSHEAKLSNARLEKALGAGTTRDLKVVAALSARWGE